MAKKDFKKYVFKPLSLPLFTREVLIEILSHKSRRRAYISLSLGVGREFIEFSGKYMIIRGYKILLNEIKKVFKRMKEDDILTYSGKFVKVAFFRNRFYYKLRSVGPREAPTLEISGIHMHRISGVTPIIDSMRKVERVGVGRGMRVLDICTGLGYTAILSLRHGVREVITIEKDPNVLEMASINPWSWKLNDERVSIYLGDAIQVVKTLPDEYFDRIIHDPPRFALAPDLYSREFYRELYRLLKRGGVMYHYTGTPGKFKGVDLAGGVMKRLRSTGFRVVRDRENLGVLAFKG